MAVKTLHKTTDLHRVAAIARNASSQFTPAEMQDAISAPPAISEIFDELLAEATWPIDRPARVPKTGHRA